MDLHPADCRIDRLLHCSAVYDQEDTNVAYCLGDKHLARRTLGWTIIVLLAIGALAAAVLLPQPYFSRLELFAATFIGCCAVFFVFLFVCANYTSPLRVSRIDGQFAWIAGVNRDYLNALPALPTYESTYAQKSE
ncbi:MAG: hypothetical protein ACI9HK_005592 [Pirellulaceae bacterium]|jgi:hypothetical protein